MGWGGVALAGSLASSGHHSNPARIRHPDRQKSPKTAGAQSQAGPFLGLGFGEATAQRLTGFSSTGMPQTKGREPEVFLRRGGWGLVGWV